MRPTRPAAPERLKPATPPDWRLGLARAGVIVGIGALATRLLGFSRDVLVATGFGATSATDVLNVAMVLPITVFGVLSTAMTSAIIAALSRPNQNDAQSTLLGDSLVFVIGTSLVTMGALVALANPVVHWIAPGFTAPETAFAAAMIRIMAPTILFQNLTAWAVGLAQSKRRFLGSALTGVVHNGPVILFVVWAIATHRSIEVVAWGMVVGTTMQLLVMIPDIWRRVGTIRCSWRLSTMVESLGPLLIDWTFMLGASLAATALPIIDRIFASSMQAGLLTDLVLATRLSSLTYTVLGSAMATVIYPTLAAVSDARNGRAFDTIQWRGFGLASFFALPIAAVLVLMPGTVVRVVLQHGAFNATDAHQTALALLWLGTGAVAMVWTEYLNRVHFARGSSRTAAIAGLLMTGVKLGASAALVRALGELGLAMATAAAYWASAAWLLWPLFQDRQWRADLAPVARRTVLFAFMAAVSVGSASAIMRVLGPWIGLGFLRLVASFLGSLGVAAAVYLILGRVAGVEEGRLLQELLGRARTQQSNSAG